MPDEPEFNVLIDALHDQLENLKERGAPVDYAIPDSVAHQGSERNLAC
jgi:hypothetical protein